jgi:H+/Cl- antiporter ClcA
MNHIPEILGLIGVGLGIVGGVLVDLYGFNDRWTKAAHAEYRYRMGLRLTFVGFLLGLGVLIGKWL